MNAPAALVGTLVDLDPRSPRDPMIARVALPRGEFDDVIRQIGLPHLHPSVGLVACRRPDHPLTHVDVLAAACAQQLADLLDAGARISPELLHALGRIGAFGAVRRRDLTAPPPASPEAP